MQYIIHDANYLVR